MSETDDQPTGDCGGVPAESEPDVPEERVGVVARIGVKTVEFYQKALSPLLPPSCRFQPTCSEYTRRAIRRHGLFRGSWLGLKRILKCHPFHPGGHDPVP